MIDKASAGANITRVDFSKCQSFRYLEKDPQSRWRSRPAKDQWGAPAKWIQRLPLWEPDLAFLIILLWLAYPDPLDKIRRSHEGAKILDHWHKNLTDQPHDGPAFRPRATLAALRKAWKLAERRVVTVQAYLLPLTLAEIARENPDFTVTGPASVNKISKAIAAAQGKRSDDTVRAELWNAARSVVHLADAIYQLGSLTKFMNSCFDGDTLMLKKVLDDAEGRRRMSVVLDVRHTVQFRYQEVEKS